MEGIVTLQRRLRDRAEAQTLRAFTPWLKPGAPTGRRKAAQLPLPVRSFDFNLSLPSARLSNRIVVAVLTGRTGVSKG